jgi:chorismate-pyruvate lyase
MSTDPRILDRLRNRLTASGDASVGTLAVARGWITQEQLRDGLREAKKTGTPLGEVLIAKKALTRAQFEELILAK